jgi:hypothetical protein
MLKDEFPPSINWFKDKVLQVDLGFQGIVDDYQAQKIRIPHKRKRVKKGLSNELTPEQKEHNKEVAAERVDIEHSIGQIKVCRSIHQVVRLKGKTLLDKMVLVAAGLANFKKIAN